MNIMPRFAYSKPTLDISLVRRWSMSGMNYSHSLVRTSTRFWNGGQESFGSLPGDNCHSKQCLLVDFGIESTR